MANQFDYYGAKKAGYSDEEISSYLNENYSKKFNVEDALKSGYSTEEVSDFLNKENERGPFEKLGRLATQVAIGSAEKSLFPYEVAVAPLASKDFQSQKLKEELTSDIENLEMQKQYSKDWSPQDEEHLQGLINTIKNPEELEKNTHPFDISSRGITEQITGLDLHPEGVLEKAASWWGFLKDPRKIKDLYNIGLKPKELFKFFMPGTEEVRSLTAGTALQMAEANQFGPLGTLAFAVVGDLIGHGPKAIKYVAQNPQKSAARVTNFFTGSGSKRNIAKGFVEEAKKSGIQLDAGSITQSDLVKFIQARVVQSGLTGDALENFKKDLSSQIIKEYTSILDEVGNLKFENNYQAAEAIKEALKVEEISLGSISQQPKKTIIQGEEYPLKGRINEEPIKNYGQETVEPGYKENFLQKISKDQFKNDAQAGRELKAEAQTIKQPIKENLEKRWAKLNRKILRIQSSQTSQMELAENLESFIRNRKGSLLLGESSPEARVLKAAEDLLKKIKIEGSYRVVSIDELLKTKRTLGDVANWEFGGSNFESSYKKLVGDIDEAIKKTLQEKNPSLREEFEILNSDYSNYKNTFENKNVLPLFEPKNNNYNTIFNSIVKDPDKLKAVEAILEQTPKGRKTLKKLKRDFADKQVSRSSFSDRDVRNLQEVLGPSQTSNVENFSIENHLFRNPPPRVVPSPPRAKKGKPLGLSVKNEKLNQNADFLKSRKVSPTNEHLRKKTGDFLRNKSSDQIMKMMDSVEGIKKLRQLLDYSEESRQLFKDLSRYKLDEMISKKMADSVTEQIKLGKFSDLLQSTENQAIAKELLGKEAYDKILLLQKNSGRLAESANKFFNASKSGVVAIDVGAMTSAAVGVLTGNPFLFMSSVGSVLGLRVVSNLLADPIFLKELEKSLYISRKDEFVKILKKIEIQVEKATLEAERTIEE